MYIPMAELMKISKKEYDGMKETIETLQSPDMMKQILESEKNIKAGRTKKFTY
jgi:PHD/YefM family antitoxin component YafN of YafNO toxin-antitoxin module